MTERNNYGVALRWLPIYNSTGETIPPNSLVELEGEQEGANGETALIALKPRTDSCMCYITGHNSIRDGEYGCAMFGDSNLVVATSTALTAGDGFGAEAGNFKGVLGKTGFRAMADGGATDEQPTYYRVQADRGTVATGMAGEIYGLIVDGPHLGSSATGWWKALLSTRSGTVWTDSATEIAVVPITEGQIFSPGTRYPLKRGTGTYTLSVTLYDIYIAMGDANIDGTGSPFYAGYVSTQQQGWLGTKSIFGSFLVGGGINPGVQLIYYNSDLGPGGRGSLYLADSTLYFGNPPTASFDVPGPPSSPPVATDPYHQVTASIGWLFNCIVAAVQFGCASGGGAVDLGITGSYGLLASDGVTVLTMTVKGGIITSIA